MLEFLKSRKNQSDNESIQKKNRFLNMSKDSLLSESAQKNKNIGFYTDKKNSISDLSNHVISFGCNNCDNVCEEILQCSICKENICSYCILVKELENHVKNGKYICANHK